MNRIDALTARLVDGDLAAGEEEELERLVAADPAAEALHRELLEVEGTLRAAAPPADAVARTVARLDRDLGGRIADGVMGRLRALPHPHGRPRRGGFVRPALAAAAAVLVCAAVLVATRGRPDATARAEPVPDGAVVTTPEGRMRVFAYGDGTTVSLDGGSELRFASDGARTRVHLVAGALDAEVAPRPAGRPMVFTTPTTEATVLGTRLTLAQGPGGALLDVAEGEVRFASLWTGRAAVVTTGHFAVSDASGAVVSARRPGAVSRAALLERVRTDAPAATDGEAAAPTPEEAGGTVAAPGSPSLLANGAFAAWDAGGLPAGWFVYGDFRQRLARDAHEVPPGCAQGLRVDVTSADECNGQVLQRVRGWEPGATYVVEGLVRSTRARGAYLQVKLRKQRTEMARISTGASAAGWTRVWAEFSPGDVDEVLVLCRWRQDAAFVGQSAWFADVRLREKGGGQAPLSARPAAPARTGDSRAPLP